MKGIVLDVATVGTLFNQIEAVVNSSREQMDGIQSKYLNNDTHQTIVDSKDLLKTYGNAADDYSKLCFMLQGIIEAIVDVKYIKRSLAGDNVSLAPALIKPYKYRADNLIDQLTDLKEACNFAKQGMEARVRYLNSVTYTSYDKALGARC